MKVPQREPYELAMSDMILAHTAILLSANHWVRLGGNPATIASARHYHKVKAVRMIIERLGNPASAILGGTVGAIAGMALAEVRISLQCFELNFQL
jgi:hypothetical protein